MQGYINKQGDYYESDRTPGDPLAPSRPLPGGTWNFVTNAWAYSDPFPDFGVFEVAIHTDPAMTDALLGAFFGDSKGRGNLLMVSLQFAVASGDYTRVNRLYADMKTTPPTGMTTANMQAIGQHAADAHFPITP
jgi:hypothetical protein